MKLKRPWLQLLKRLADEPGSALIIETVDEGSYTSPARFRGHFAHAPCAVCRHAQTEPVRWRTIFSLAERDLLRERLSGTGRFSELTPAGREAIEAISRSAA